MSKMSQHFMGLPYDEQENESGIPDDPYYQIWADELDKEDIEHQDNEEPPFQRLKAHLTSLKAQENKA